MLDVVQIRVEREPTAGEITKREREWVAMVKAGDYAIEWHELPGGVEFSSALRLPVGCDGAMVRVAVRYHTAVEILDILGARLPTKEQADLLFRNALHVPPVVSRPTHRGSPTSASFESMAAISNRIDMHIAKARRKHPDAPAAVDNEGKLWLRGADENEAINYGLVDYPQPGAPNVPPKRANGLHLWQDVGRWHDLPGKENDLHVDGTHTVRGVKSADNGRVTLEASRSYLGERGLHVLKWQRELQRAAAELDAPAMHPGKADGIHGPKTEAATLAFLALDAPTPPQGELDFYAELENAPSTAPSADIPIAAPSLPPTTHMQARSYHKGRKGGSIDLAVIHVAEIDEVMNAAEALGTWAARSAPVSWHSAIDADSHVTSVAREDTAWAAPGANHNGIQYELAGWTRQSKEEWDDEYSRATLDNAARIVAKDCVDFDIPMIKLSSLDLQEGKRGICGHDTVSAAFKKSTHGDPGPNFPWSEFIAKVREYGAAFAAAKEQQS